MSSETVIRILKKFFFPVHDGIIQMEGKSIKVMDFERLVRISELDKPDLHTPRFID